MNSACAAPVGKITGGTIPVPVSPLGGVGFSGSGSTGGFGNILSIVCGKFGASGSICGFACVAGPVIGSGKPSGPG